METPIADFVRRYAESDTARLHMPGHKGKLFLGCEAMDITEIAGADALYEAAGIIAESERNAARLFGTARTVYATEGSSQCIRAMLYLAVTARAAGTPPVIVAARNVHKAFVYAAALLDFEVVWLYPQERRSVCSCDVSAEALARTLEALSAPPAAVYVTSPDYLGGEADIAALAAVCHRHGTVLAVDNAHGAYLHFLAPGRHPMDAGADICCDSAHKTLPVLTGGAYLHIGAGAPAAFAQNAKLAMALFGSTSPSYLTLASLDLCNRYLADGYSARLAQTVARLDEVKARLTANGWRIAPSDPLKLTIDAAASGIDGAVLAEALRRGGVECEYADPAFVVLMATPENTPEELWRAVAALGENRAAASLDCALPISRHERVMPIRQAVFAPHETVSAKEAAGHVCASPTVSCPPAIPIVVSGERIEETDAALFARCGVEWVDVVKEG